MPILTKSAVVKNVPTPFTLTKSLLAALPLVSSDPYFSVQLNWNKIVLVYKSSIGEQKSIVIFEASQEVPSGDFFISSKARDFFNVERIDIYDFDNDRISIPRSALNAIEFDINMTPAVPVTDTIDNNPTGELQYMYYLLGAIPYDRHDISNPYPRSLVHAQSVILSSPVTISTVTFKMQRKTERIGGITHETMQGRIYLSILAGEELVGVMLADSSPIECMSISTSISDVTFTLLAPVNLPVGTYTLRLEGEHIIGYGSPPNAAWIKGYGFPSGATDGGARMGWGDNSETGIYISKYRTMSYYYLIN